MRSALALASAYILLVVGAFVCAVCIEPSLHTADSRPQIYPGVEAVAVSFLAPAFRALGDAHPVADVRLQQTAIVLAFDGADPTNRCTQPPGTRAGGRAMVEYIPGVEDFGFVAEKRVGRCAVGRIVVSIATCDAMFADPCATCDAVASALARADPRRV